MPIQLTDRHEQWVPMLDSGFARSTAINSAAPTPAPAASPFVAARSASPLAASAMAQPSQATEEDDDKPAWLRAAHKVAKGIASLAGVDEQSDGGLGQQPDQRRAAAVLRKITTAPADTFERLSGRSLDETFAEIRRTHAEEIPDDLDRDEKGMLLMQLGLGIMTGGPGLVQALGQAGLQTMGTWHDLRAQKRRAGAEDKRDRIGMLETEARIAAGREAAEAKAAADMAEAQRKAEQPVRMGPGDVLLDPQTQQPLYIAPRAPQQAPAEPADLRMMRAQGVDPTDPDAVTAFYQRKRAGTAQGGDKPLREERVAKYYARALGISEAEAVRFAKASADSQVNPDKMRLDFVKIFLAEEPTNTEGALAQADRLVSLMQQGPDAAAAAIEKMPKKERRTWTEAIKSMVGLGVDDGQTVEAAEPTPTSPTPAATGPAPDAPLDELIEFYDGGGR